MKSKILLSIAIFSLISLTAWAQDGGIKGKVVSRSGRIAIPNAKVVLQTSPERVELTESDGTFTFTGIASGEYRISVQAPEYNSIELLVKVERSIKDINLIMLSYDMTTSYMDDTSFSEFDTESSNDANATPVSLSASRDVFDNIAGYKFGDRRFRVRGYETSLGDVSVNSVYLNDAMTGYTPWSLWSGLNEATRNQEISSGLMSNGYGVGDINGATNIDMTATSIRKGFRASVVNASGQYRLRLMATYGSGELDNGWSYAFSASTRQGGNDWVNGVYYNGWSYYAGAKKKLDHSNTIALTVFAAPTQRGVQAAATQEVYDMLGNNHYNPNWGMQGDRKRNARVRNTHEPVTILNYEYKPNNNFKLTSAVAYRFGRNGYSALDWYDAPDPRPDYYRNLPSYFKSELQKNYVREGWRSSLNIRQINWEKMYQANYESTFQTDFPGATPGVTTRSKYVIEERMTNQNDLNANVQMMLLLRSNSKITAGVAYRRNRTEYFKKMKDLLGGQYWLDVDQFAERDFEGATSEIQNDLNNPNRLISKGDKYGYDYYAHVRNANLWINYELNTRYIDAFVGLDGGYTRFWREGLYRKGLFPNNSFGNAKKQNFNTYIAKGGVALKINAANKISVNVGYTQRAPYFQDAYVSPRTRNSTIDGLTTEKSFSTDLSYSLRTPWLRLRATGYYTTTKDQTKLISFYDDISGSFTNFAMHGINQLNTGVEVGFEIPIVRLLSIKGAMNYGYYKYTSNPYVTQTVDNSDQILIRNERVYWKDYKVGGTPMTAVNLGLNYRTRSYWFFGVDCNYYDAMYIDMNPLYRTDGAHKGLSKEDSQKMAAQEMFPSAFVLNANVGKSWMIQRKYNLGFSLEAKNLLNSQDIKTGGYEQMRLKKIASETNNKVIDHYERFDSKYFYMFGTTYYLNVYFRF